MLHQDRYVAAGSDITRMIDPVTKQIVFVPRGDSSHFTDPSYHLPAFYELYARWASAAGDYWREAAEVSRAYFKTAAHPTTGLFPDYSLFDGTPTDPGQGGHADFRFDAWRVIQNVVDRSLLVRREPWAVEEANRWQGFFAARASRATGTCSNWTASRWSTTTGRGWQA